MIKKIVSKFIPSWASLIKYCWVVMPVCRFTNPHQLYFWQAAAGPVKFHQLYSWCFTFQTVGFGLVNGNPGKIMNKVNKVIITCGKPLWSSSLLTETAGDSQVSSKGQFPIENEGRPSTPSNWDWSKSITKSLVDILHMCRSLHIMNKGLWEHEQHCLQRSRWKNKLLNSEVWQFQR